jgi:hypothetical protein
MKALGIVAITLALAAPVAAQNPQDRTTSSNSSGAGAQDQRQGDQQQQGGQQQDQRTMPDDQNATGTAGQDNALPATASPLGAIGLFGFASLFGAALVRRLRSF